MLNSGKKIRAHLTLVLSEILFLNETKNHNPPPFKLNGRSLSNNMIKHSQTVLLKSLQNKFNFCLSSGIYQNS